MIVYASKPGQLGNLLIVSASLRAFRLETGVPVAVPAFHDYNRYFTGTEKSSSSSVPYRIFYSLCRILHRSGISNRLVSCTHVDWHERLDLDGQNRYPALWLIQGWQVRCNRGLKKHAAAVRAFFSPALPYRLLLEKFRQTLETKNIIVGIHIRRGDYRIFENGRYFYSFPQYKNIMLTLLAQFGSEQVTFLVSSNEPVPKEELEDPSLRIAYCPGHELLDLYALAGCNYIAGPPSTYTMWASFYGNVPLYMIRDPHQAPLLNEFSIQESF